MAFRPIAISRT